MKLQPSVTAFMLALVLTAATGCRDEAQTTCTDCGEIESIQPQTVAGEPSPAAAVAGAIVGGIIGHQFGSGSGNDAATAAGAIGGAVAGSEVDKRRKSHTVYEVVINMDHGGRRELTLASRDGFQPGDKVRVRDDRITPL